MPLCVRNSHYVTVVLQKLVTGESQCFIVDSTGRDNFFSAGRQSTVELLYSYIETTRLRLNPVIVDVIETDEASIRVVQEELVKTASMPLTTAICAKITELTRKLELLQVRLRPEIKWLEGIEQDGSFECGLAVAGNIALHERVTEGGQLLPDFTEICRTMPNLYGTIGYSREMGLPALVEACSLALGADVGNEKTARRETFDRIKAQSSPEKLQYDKFLNAQSKVSSPMNSKKRKLRQTSLLRLFNASSKKTKHDRT